MPQSKRKALLQVTEGCTLKKALNIYLREYEIALTEKELRQCVFLVNNETAGLDKALSDNDTLTFFRPSVGG